MVVVHYSVKKFLEDWGIGRKNLTVIISWSLHTCFIDDNIHNLAEGECISYLTINPASTLNPINKLGRSEAIIAKLLSTTAIETQRSRQIYKKL